MNGGGANNGANMAPGQKPDDFDANRYSLVGSDNDDENPMQQSIISSDDDAPVQPKASTNKYFGRRSRNTEIKPRTSIIGKDSPDFFNQALNQANFEEAQAYKPPKSPKNKKRIIVFSVIAALIICGACIGVSVWNNILRPKQELASLQAKFNTFANFFLYGEESAEEITEDYRYGEHYYLANLELTDEDIDNHYEKSIELYKDFYSLYQKYTENYPDTLNEELSKYADSYLEKIEKYYYLSTRPLLMSNDILAGYLREPGVLVDHIDEFYKRYDNAESSALREIKSEWQAKAMSLIRAYDTFNYADCMDYEEEKIKPSCKKYPENDELRYALEVISDYDASYSNFWTDNTKNDIWPYQYIWKIEERLVVQ